MRFTALFTYFLISFHLSFAQIQLQWNEFTFDVKSSIRGLSVVNDKVAWVSGSKGFVAVTTDGGKTWVSHVVKDFEKSEFRTIYAFDAKNAIIANAGSPAYILKTNDGGVSWKTVFQNDDPEAFIDGGDFWNNKEGLLYGDPIKGRMLLIRTSDGGKQWTLVSENERPLLRSGEASFAASGTGIRCFAKSKVMIATGGLFSKLLQSSDKGKHWDSLRVPMIQGKPSTGIFSVAVKNENNVVVTGGDYQIDSLMQDHVFYSVDGGNQWKAPVKPTRGYRECVEYINDKTLIAVGPAGSDISYDGGKTWQVLHDDKGYHVIRKARKGNLIIMAGQGKVKVTTLAK